MACHGNVVSLEVRQGPQVDEDILPLFASKSLPPGHHTSHTVSLNTYCFLVQVFKFLLHNCTSSSKVVPCHKKKSLHI
jgi:hypothetical protein